jgi:hypothetical protein
MQCKNVLRRNVVHLGYFVDRSADILVDAQLSLARGTSYLFKADSDDAGKARKPILVTDPEEIAAFLADDYNALETTYYTSPRKSRETTW